MLQKFNLNFLLQYLSYFIPISLVLGSLVVNTTVFLFLFLSIFYFIKNNIKINFDFQKIFLLLFFISVIFSSYLNIDIIGKENFVKSVLLLKFFFIYIFLETLFAQKRINLQVFLIICLILTLFISLDSIFQFHSGKNIIGYPLHDGRVGSIFGSEAIAGAFIQKFFIFSLIGVYLITQKKNLRINYFEIFFYLLTFYAAFVASNRMSFIIIFFSILAIFFIINQNKKNFFIILLILVPVFSYLFNTNDTISSKYNDFKHKIHSAVYIFYEDNENIVHIAPDNYGRIYYTALKSFKEDVFFGSGLKSFRYKCPNLSKEKKILCSTHPHNYHLEVLHDSGLLGFLFLSLFVFSILISKIKVILKHSTNRDEKIVFSLILLNFIIEIFPLKSTGSLFSTWTGTILWMSISLIGHINKDKLYAKTTHK